MMSENCEVLIDYFNNQLTKEQEKEFELHLLTCPACSEELEALKELTEDLPYSSEAIVPPNGMKERILSNIVKGPENENVESTVEQPEIQRAPPNHQWRVPKGRKKQWYKPLIAAILTVSLVGNGVAIIYFSNDQEKVEPAPTPEESSFDTVREMISLSPSEGIEAQATAVMIEQNGATNLVVQAEDLPSLEGEETYQVWVLQDGRPSRAGTFILNEKGIGAASYIINKGTDHPWDTIAITKEPNANSQEPKGDILLSSPI